LQNYPIYRALSSSLDSRNQLATKSNSIILAYFVDSSEKCGKFLANYLEENENIYMILQGKLTDKRGKNENQ
jgi:hypothetical protein